ncbi:hypothetical protein [Actinoplanes regularis]|uniref:hypothetical protein n=1 Tax=Actinoplanes regularis TaxID=52697 RepID=UPI0011775F7D|nr:hypothetical protein [Actinoplanes regularis]
MKIRNQAHMSEMLQSGDVGAHIGPTNDLESSDSSWSPRVLSNASGAARKLGSPLWGITPGREYHSTEKINLRGPATRFPWDTIVFYRHFLPTPAIVAGGKELDHSEYGRPRAV